jgi:hypothetical protein
VTQKGSERNENFDISLQLLLSLSMKAVVIKGGYYLCCSASSKCQRYETTEKEVQL